MSDNEEDLVDIEVTEGNEEISEFTSIAFSLFSSDEVKKISVVEVKESKLSGEGSVYDPRMGVILNHAICVTCKKTNKDCPGHAGHIELPVPVAHPMYPSEILMYLNCFCSECSSMLIEPDVMKFKGMFRLKSTNRIRAISEFCEKVLSCPVCDEDKYTFYYDAKHDHKYYKYIDNKKDNIPVTSAEIENILGRIKRSDVKRLGLDPDDVHPEFLIITRLLVLPICARPFVETSRGPCDDDLTSKYIDIIKACNKLRAKTISEIDRQQLVNTLEFHVRTLMYNHKNKARQINGRPIKCIRARVNGKEGLFRNNLSGKRNDFTGRTVIGPDPRIRADEIVIPEEFAEKETFPENVNNFNIKVLEELVNNGKANYVIRDGKNYNLKTYLKSRVTYEVNGFVLELGDIIIRDEKKIDPVKFKEKTGRDISVLPTDKIIRNKKILKNIKPAERVQFELEADDVVLRGDKWLYPEKIRLSGGIFEFKPGDRVFREGKELKNISISQKRYFKLKVGDVVERHIRNGDIVLFGRQPTYCMGRNRRGESLLPPSFHSWIILSNCKSETSH